ncbi:MAG: AMP-binding protein, partial [Gemmatimonadetes bacterium]|nr:AMP-binding protein [Gemmatimonadota bacterium]
FFEQEQPVPSHHNQSMLLEVDPSVDDVTLAAALPAVLEHHDALRLRFRRTASGWEAWHAPEVGIALERVDLAGLPAAERDRIQGEVAGARQASLELERGPVGRAVLFDRGEGRRVLLLVLHHLVVDGVSWRILREDLERACTQVQAREPVDLGPRGTSFRQWSEVLREYAASEALRAEAEYWLAQGADGVAPLPAEGGERTGGIDTVSVRLEPDETRALLQEVPAAYRTRIDDVLLCALVEAVSGWTGSPRVRLALEGHGREEEVGAGVDLTRTVGWFTSVYPVVLDVAGAAGPGERLGRIKEQLRAVPLRGIGYGVLRYLSPDALLRARLAAQGEPEIAFNYLGRFDRDTSPSERLRFADGERGREWAPENRHPYPLEVSGGIAGGTLLLSWTYDVGRHRRATIERLAAAHLAALRALVAHCLEEGAGGYTPSDFPLAELTRAELDAVTVGRRVDDLYPLTPMQEGMLFHSLHGDGAQAYQVQIAQLLEGPLDVALLRRAWDEVVARHPVLRTSFVWEGVRRPLQRVEAEVRVPWTVEEWPGLSGEEQEAALERYLAEDSRRGFALGEAPLLRFALFRVAPDAHWLVWSQHHLLLDGWASARVVGEVMRLYRAWNGGGTAVLERVRPYRDYVRWLGRQDPAAPERYWRGVLAGFASPTPLGVDRAAGPAAGVRYARRSTALPPERTRRVEEAARRAGVTINVVLQGAWSVLLSLYSGEDDVVFGTVVAGRPAELEGSGEMVGLFINTLPVRVRLPDEARLSPWLAGVQRSQVEAREHEHAPLVRVQGWSEVPGGTPLFESLLVFENFPAVAGGSDAGGELRLTRARSVEWPTYPLCLTGGPGSELLLDLSYDESRFDAATVERMLEHLVHLLDQVASADPGLLLADLCLVGEAERRRVVEEWNRTERAYPRDAGIHELFAARVARTPDAMAVVSDQESLTYAELDARANRLARHLWGRGVGPETRVAICVERGPEMAVAILGVLKAGGAYVPLDPNYPAGHLAYLLEDSGARVLVTQETLLGMLPEHSAAVVLTPLPRPLPHEGGGEHYGASDPSALPQNWGGGGRSPSLSEAGGGVRGQDSRESQPALTPQPPLPMLGEGENVDPDTLAYVIYTSGSTGTPKGVAVPHRALVNFATDVAERLGLGPADRFLQFASPGFDVVVEELFPAWVAGAAVVFPPGNRLAPGELLEVLERERVTALELPTAYWHEWVHALAASGRRLPGCVRLVLVGGERVLPERLAEWSALGVPLVHVFGLTETACTSAALRLEAGDDGSRWPNLPVGTPTGNARTYVLDQWLHPAPVGVPGELWIGGAGVARGYLGRP